MEDTNVTGGEVTADGFTVSSTTEASDAMRENFASEEKPKDGEPDDPEKAEAEKRSKAAAELGKAGGKAAAEARAKADKEPDKPKAAADPKSKNGEDEETDTAGDKKTGHPRDDARARVMDATRKLAEEREARKAAEAKLAALEAERTKPKDDAKPAAEGDDPEPSVENFGSYEEYVKKQARWEARQELKAVRKQDEEVHQRDRALEGVRKRTGAFSDRMLAAEKADPTMHDRVDVALLQELAPTYVLPPGAQRQAINDLSEAIIDSDQGPALLLHLSEHPEELDRIRRLPDQPAVMRAVGRLEALVSKEASPEPAQKPTTKPETYVSGAKPPMKPLPTAALGSEDFSDEDDLGEHIRKAEAQEKRQRAGR